MFLRDYIMFLWIRGEYAGRSITCMWGCAFSILGECSHTDSHQAPHIWVPSWISFIPSSQQTCDGGTDGLATLNTEKLKQRLICHSQNHTALRLALMSSLCHLRINSGPEALPSDHRPWSTASSWEGHMCITCCQISDAPWSEVWSLPPDIWRKGCWLIGRKGMKCAPDLW